MMLSQRGEAFLEKHKRRSYVSDLDFVNRLFTKLGVSPTEHLLIFQDVFAGHVSPSHSGQFVWGLGTSNAPIVTEREGQCITPCSDAFEKGLHIDAQGRLYTSDHLQTPVASSCFQLFEQMALIYEWQDALDLVSTADGNDVKHFREIVVPRIKGDRVEELSDPYSQLYRTDSLVILDRVDGPFAWFRDDLLPECVQKVFGKPRSTKCNNMIRFPEQVRSLFSDAPHRLLG